MPFKTIRAPGSALRLSGFSLLACSGADASAFLQAQTMNDVRELASGQWHWNGWLNAKGRVIALFALVRLDETQFLAVLPDFPATELLPLLQRFVFRSKAKLEVCTDLVAATPSEGSPDDGWTSRDRVSGSREAGLSLDFSGDSERRQLLLLPQSDPALAPADPARDAAWLSTDLAHGLPRLPVDQRESWTPQMLSLERLHAFSLKKGCYPGQEIVARTHYLGQAKRGLSRVQGAGLEAGATLRDVTGSAIGTVVCVAADAGSGLAVLQSDKRAEPAWIGDSPVTLPDFLGGLQRPL